MLGPEAGETALVNYDRREFRPMETTPCQVSIIINLALTLRPLKTAMQVLAILSGSTNSIAIS